MLRVCDRRGSGGDMVERRQEVEAGRREGKELQTPKKSRDEGREHGDGERKRKRSRKRSAKERSRPIPQYFGARFPHFQGRRVQAPRVIQHLVAFAPSFFPLLRRLPSPVSAYIHTSSSSPSSSRSTPAPPPLKKIIKTHPQSCKSARSPRGLPPKSQETKPSAQGRSLCRAPQARRRLRL